MLMDLIRLSGSGHVLVPSFGDPNTAETYKKNGYHTAGLRIMVLSQQTGIARGWITMMIFSASCVHAEDLAADGTEI